MDLIDLGTQLLLILSTLERIKGTFLIFTPISIFSLFAGLLQLRIKSITGVVPSFPFALPRFVRIQ